MRKWMWLMMILALSVAGCATQGPDAASRASTVESADQALVNQINLRLSRDPVTSRLLLGIQSDDGIVTLSGRIDQPAVRARAVAIARSVSGVRGVIDKTVQF